MTAPFADLDVPPRRRKAARRGESVGGFAFGGAACLLLVAALIWATHRPAPARPLVAPLSSPRLVWTDLAGPPLFGLPEGALSVETTSAHAATLGDRRRDARLYGTFASGAYLALALEDQGAGGERRPFFADIARRSALEGLAVDRAAAPEAKLSRFGPLSLADARLVRGARARDCLVFRTEATEVELSGLGCDAAPDRTAFVCLIDRVALLGAAPSRYLRLFERAARVSPDPACASDGQLPPLATAVVGPPSPRRAVRRSARLRRTHFHLR